MINVIFVEISQENQELKIIQNITNISENHPPSKEGWSFSYKEGSVDDLPYCVVKYRINDFSSQLIHTNAFYEYVCP